jgi:GDP-mannose 6-dehydrogenase
MNSMLDSNEEHKARLSEFVLANCGNTIVMQGLTFKANTDDLRESPLVDLARQVLASNRELTILDKNVNLESLRTQFPDLAPYVAPHMKEIPASSQKVSLVISKGTLSEYEMNIDSIIDLTFEGIEKTAMAVERWVMG